LISDLAELFYGVPISQTVKDKLRNDKLWTVKNLTSITKDKEWSDAVTAYLANPATTDPMAKSVPARMQSLVAYMMTAAELQLH
jgi:cobalamin biosynthesis Mg chelatase CobN